MEKRLISLSDALNNGNAGPVGSITALVEIAKALEVRNYNEAYGRMQEWYTRHGGHGWSVGVKRLVETVCQTQHL